MFSDSMVLVVSRSCGSGKNKLDRHHIIKIPFYKKVGGRVSFFLLKKQKSPILIRWQK